MTVISIRAGFHTWSPATLGHHEPPKLEHICGECVTDDEIVYALGPAVEFVLAVLADRSKERPDLMIALETARTLFMVRNNSNVPNRVSALRALGLNE